MLFKNIVLLPVISKLLCLIVMLIAALLLVNSGQINLQVKIKKIRMFVIYLGMNILHKVVNILAQLKKQYNFKSHFGDCYKVSL